ncbi:MAG TPA: hypothetical protein P5105_05025 [Victivallales bacterium]|nr:hypothetical protein [Victivallales bacterium]HRR06626.1 hypothetical protein [Victivallales bacterium]HRR28549.1 hypothetical protein [Victivallales bacterium]HRU01447.1 hypothetical protein [Victivallales bacterium]
MKDKIKTLVKLIEDEDIETASKAMAEVLRNQRTAWRVISILQESSNPHLRKTAHQMQYALTCRERQKKLAKKLLCENLNLLETLIEIHLLWFDEDSEHALKEQWSRFRNLSKNWDANSIQHLAEMMKALSLQSSPFEELECADYCIGEIISSGKGADFMLCSIAKIIASDESLSLSVIATDAGFCLYDEQKHIGLFPDKNWTLAQCKINNNVKRWNNVMLANLTISSLMFCSIASGDLRYTYIIGSTLLKSLDSEFEKIMPYPLGKK